jgi:hypothetical protein
MKLTARELDLLLITMTNDKKGKKPGDFKSNVIIKGKMREPFKEMPKPEAGKELTKEDLDKQQIAIEEFLNTEFEIDLKEGELNIIKAAYSRFDDFSSSDAVEKMILALNEKLGL